MVGDGPRDGCSGPDAAVRIRGHRRGVSHSARAIMPQSKREAIGSQNAEFAIAVAIWGWKGLRSRAASHITISPSRCALERLSHGFSVILSITWVGPKWSSKP
jgi:hypothetical protein